MHALVININPKGTTAILGDCPEQQMGPLGPDLFLFFSRQLHTNQKEVKDTMLDPLNQPAIGVMVSGGQCTVRRLRIVPQAEATE
jgi:hypothetical protein